MSNQYPSGYPSVPVSSGLMNSPHSYTGSPGPMSMNPGMQPMPSGMVPAMNSGMGPGMGPVMNPGMQPSMNPNMGPGMGPGMPPGMNPGMNPGGNPGMNSGMGMGMGGGMHSSMQGGMQSGMQGGMPPGMPPGMQPGMTGGMQPGMGPGMSSVLSSALGGNIAPPLTSRMSPVMPSGMGQAMQHPMQSGMTGNMAVPMAGGMPQGIPGMSPMQYSMSHPQPNISQVPSGMMQGPMPSNTPTDSMNNSNVNNQASAIRHAPHTPTAGATDNQTTTPSRDINTASLCRIGQETVQDIVSRTQEIFQTLKTIQPPNGTAAGANAANEKKLKVQEQLRTIQVLLFKRLRLIFEKCNDNSQLQGMEYTHIESLIPLKDEWDVKSEERKTSEAYRQATEEHKELIEAVNNKNKLLKDIIDHMRRIIWEINTMLMMRRS